MLPLSLSLNLSCVLLLYFFLDFLFKNIILDFLKILWHCTGSIERINSTTLSMLNLSSNELSGPLPPSIGNCHVVDLSRNLLSDDIGVTENWGSNLEILDLNSNKLTGSVPIFSQSHGLTRLSIGNNSLSGNVPPELGQSTKLALVDLSSNDLDGNIPHFFFASTTLTNLNLSGNHLTGPIPIEGSSSSELLVLPSYPQLESVDLSDNFLTGDLPTDVGNFGRLKLLNVARNNLSGHLPNELEKLSALEYLDLSSNNFTGSIPDKLSSNLHIFNVSNNNLEGTVPENLRNFPDASFHPGNNLLSFPKGPSGNGHAPSEIPNRGGKHHSSKSSIRIAIILASIGAAAMIAFVLLAYYRAQLQDFRSRSGFGSQTVGRDVKLGKLPRPSLFKFHTAVEPPPTSLSFSTDHLLPSNSRTLSGPLESNTEIVEHVLPEGIAAGSVPVNTSSHENRPATSERKSSPGSPIASSPRFIDTLEQPVTLDVYSPDRLAGELFFLDTSLAFTAEELSRAPAEVLGRSSHGTLYKATLDNGHMLTVKWLRVGLVKNKKEFAKEAKKIGSVKHPNVVPLRAYYWGPREQERLILADYIQGDSLALHLYGNVSEHIILCFYSPTLVSDFAMILLQIESVVFHLS